MQINLLSIARRGAYRAWLNAAVCAGREGRAVFDIKSRSLSVWEWL